MNRPGYFVPRPNPAATAAAQSQLVFPRTVVKRGQHHRERRELQQRAVGHGPARVIGKFPGQPERPRRDQRPLPGPAQGQRRAVHPQDRQRAHREEHPPHAQQIPGRVHRGERGGSAPPSGRRGSGRPRGRPRDERREVQPLVEGRVEVRPRQEDAGRDHRPRRRAVPVHLVPVEAEVDAPEAGDQEQRRQRQRGYVDQEAPHPRARAEAFDSGRKQGVQVIAGG